MRAKTMRHTVLMAGLAALLAGCSGAFFGPPGPHGARYAHDASSRLRIAIFEIDAMDFPMHSGLIIYAPDDRVLYDPAGFWRHPDATRRADVTRGLNPELEVSYLTRSSMLLSADHWRLHLWEVDVADEVANLAVELVLARPPYAFGACGYGVSSLLADLPGFEGLPDTFSRDRIMEYLSARDDIRYIAGDETGDETVAVRGVTVTRASGISFCEVCNGE